MIRAINDGDRTGYMNDKGVKVGTIKVNGHPQKIGKSKFIEFDDNMKVVRLLIEMPKPKAKRTVKKKEA